MKMYGHKTLTPETKTSVKYYQVPVNNNKQTDITKANILYKEQK
jgi:hypothetical protein